MSWTKEDSARLRELHTACMTVSEIAEKMKKDRTVIRQELVRMGYLPREVRPEPEKSEFTGKTISIEPRNRKAYNRITPEIAEKIAELSGQGMSVRQISQELGLSSSSVHYTLHKARKKPKEDKPMKVNKDFDDAVSEMIAEAKEKEPASVGADTSSVTKEVNSLSQDNDTTEKPKSQVLSGVAALNMMQTMISDWTGMAASIVSLFADKDVAELTFMFEGTEYLCQFGPKGVPEYGNDKH